ncbi:hypothetical protein K402DRAFT_450607 [Aulographum hederae CBS 113979]|uniref:Uncharacterized protein n=1 Tax=Aulographum hederae CBS 113979 TaxID=1176131 RepID=A0A6G1HFM9_9PEZI|nr:hypothetical protein K402DRAFT_450607 [Aulographum hederae CBS 113979]
MRPPILILFPSTLPLLLLLPAPSLSHHHLEYGLNALPESGIGGAKAGEKIWYDLSLVDCGPRGVASREECPGWRAGWRLRVEGGRECDVKACRPKGRRGVGDCAPVMAYVRWNDDEATEGCFHEGANLVLEIGRGLDEVEREWCERERERLGWGGGTG